MGTARTPSTLKGLSIVIFDRYVCSEPFERGEGLLTSESDVRLESLKSVLTQKKFYNGCSTIKYVFK